MIDAKPLLERLDCTKVRHVIIGGLAAITQGAALLTEDLDVCYDRAADNLLRIEKAFAGVPVSLRGAPANLPFRLDARTLKAGLNFTLVTPHGDFDLLGEMRPVGGYEQVLAMSDAADLYGIPCRILSIEGLLIAKKFAGRRKDMLVLPELEALKTMKERGTPPQNPSADPPPTVREPARSQRVRRPRRRRTPRV